MSDALLHLIELLSLWIAVTLLASLVSAAFYCKFRRIIVHCRPEARSWAVLCCGLVAPVVAGVVLAVLMHPELSGLLVPAHCHGGNCHPHAPVFNVGSLGGLLFIAAGTLVLAFGVGACLYGLALGRRWLRTLTAISHKPRDSGCRIVESPELLAWSYGLLRPQIFLSRGLLERLSPAQLQAVLAHEEAHGERRDNLRRFILYRATTLWPPRLKRYILEDLRDAAEEACDEAALRRVGGASLVVSVIEALKGDGPSSGEVRGAAFDPGAARQRIAALGRNRDDFQGAGIAWTLLAGLWLAQATIMTGLSHYVVEWIAATGA